MATSYSGPTQRARILSEHWVAREAYCPNCGAGSVTQYRNNNPGADFLCTNCANDFELKSQKGRFGAKIVNGAYSAMVSRVVSNNNPNLFLLNYDVMSLKVLNFLVIPRHYFVSGIIEQRKPLSDSARRAGWAGCNILLRLIPESGRIFLIRDSAVESRSAVLAQWRRTLFLGEQGDGAAKGWLLDVMRYIERLGQRVFSLSDLYAFEGELKRTYPENKHIRQKIRQQLQVLRDKGYLDFVGKGVYRLTAPDGRNSRG